jgi:PAS domain S-box-containing protein
MSLQVASEHELMLKIIDSSYDGIFMTDAKGVVIYSNEAYQRISGLQKGKIMGRKVQELVADGEIPDACTPEAIETGKAVTKVIDYYHGVCALVTSMPIFDDRGALIRVFSNVRDITDLIRLKEQLKSTDDLNKEYRNQLSKMQGDTPFIVYSTPMQNIIRLAQRVAHVTTPVLIQGESGVGKDMLARFIHNAGDLAQNRPFVQINCSAIPETLLESELFGYEPGAFTGAAKKGKIGLFELANNGTLFLDEVGEMPLPIQVKLLDVLQTAQLHRLGGTKTIRINARIIAATNSNLEKMVEEGRFRSDLYYRLNVVPIYIPPLRERKEDLVPLILHFLEHKNKKFGYAKKFSPEAADILAAYSWPGNVRELSNVIERMVIMAEGDYIEEKWVPSYIQQVTSKTHFIATPDYFDTYNLKQILDELEKEVIRKALTVFGSMRKTAAHLGVDLSTLVRKKRKYNL